MNPASQAAPVGEAVIQLRPANEHHLQLRLAGRIGREFTREQVADLAEALSACEPEHAQSLISAFLPGFSPAEYAGLLRAVREFERLAALEAERENPRNWRNTVRLPL